jgi:hypothetical protein
VGEARRLVGHLREGTDAFHAKRAAGHRARRVGRDLHRLAGRVHGDEGAAIGRAFPAGARHDPVSRRVHRPLRIRKRSTTLPRARTGGKPALPARHGPGRRIRNPAARATSTVELSSMGAAPRPRPRAAIVAGGPRRVGDASGANVYLSGGGDEG